MTLHKNKQVPYICIICRKPIGDGVKAVSEDWPKDEWTGMCGSPKCVWLDRSKEGQLQMAQKAGVGSLFIRDETLPSVEKFPLTLIDIQKPTYIVGPVGTGKTWLLSCIICDALKAGLQSLYLLSWAWFQLEIRDTYKPSSIKTELDVMNKYINQTILCIDDIGSGKDIQGRESEAARVNLLTLLDKRYSERLVTHFSSNLPPDKLADRYDKRIASRIHDMCQLVVLTENLRKTM